MFSSNSQQKKKKKLIGISESFSKNVFESN